VRLQLGIELEPEAVERHCQAGVRTDDEQHLHELALVELFSESCPGFLVDDVAVEELVRRRDQIDLERGPRLRGGAARDRVDVLRRDLRLAGHARVRVLDPLVPRARAPGDAQHHQLAQPMSERRLPSSTLL
jgi:hypothetical protein